MIELEAWMIKASLIVEQALDALDPAEREARLEHIRSSGGGTSFEVEGDVVTIMWAGLPLAVVDRLALISDDLELPPPWRNVLGVPDHVPDGWAS